MALITPRGLLPPKKGGRGTPFLEGHISGVHKLSALETLQFSLFLVLKFS